MLCGKHGRKMSMHVCSVCECIHDCVVVLIRLARLLPIVKWVDL